MKFKTNDKVIILAGKDKGQLGKIVKIFPDENKAIVEGVNLQKKHVKANKNVKGGVIEAPAAIHSSNLAIFDSQEKKASRIAFKFNKQGKKIRISKKSDTQI